MSLCEPQDLRYGDAIGLRNLGKNGSYLACRPGNDSKSFLSVTGVHPFPRTDGTVGSSEWRILPFDVEKRHEDEPVRCGDSVCIVRTCSTQDASRNSKAGIFNIQFLVSQGRERVGAEFDNPNCVRPGCKWTLVDAAGTTRRQVGVLQATKGVRLRDAFHNFLCSDDAGTAKCVEDTGSVVSGLTEVCWQIARASSIPMWRRGRAERLMNNDISKDTFRPLPFYNSILSAGDENASPGTNTSTRLGEARLGELPKLSNREERPNLLTYRPTLKDAGQRGDMATNRMQERALVEDILFCLLGVGEASFIVYDNGSRKYKFSDKTGIIWKKAFLHLASQVLPICEAYRNLKDYLAYHQKAELGLVQQRLCSCLESLLHEFKVRIGQLEALHRNGNLSLHRLWYLLQPSMESLSQLHQMCSKLWGVCGGNLIRHLERHAHNQLESFCLVSCSAPFFSILQRWLDNGDLVDPFAEFLVTDNVYKLVPPHEVDGLCRNSNNFLEAANLSDSKHNKDWNPARNIDFKNFLSRSGNDNRLWQSAYSLVSDNIPSFLASLKDRILKIGKYRAVLRSCCDDDEVPSKQFQDFDGDRILQDIKPLQDITNSINNAKSKDRNSTAKPTDIWSSQKKNLLDESAYLQKLDRVYHQASSDLLHYFIKTLQLKTRLRVFRALFFCQMGDWINAFLLHARLELEQQCGDVNMERLESLLDLSFRSTSVNALCKQSILPVNTTNTVRRHEEGRSIKDANSPVSKKSPSAGKKPTTASDGVSASSSSNSSPQVISSTPLDSENANTGIEIAVDENEDPDTTPQRNPKDQTSKPIIRKHFGPFSVYDSMPNTYESVQVSDQMINSISCTLHPFRLEDKCMHLVNLCERGQATDHQGETGSWFAQGGTTPGTNSKLHPSSSANINATFFSQPPPNSTNFLAIKAFTLQYRATWPLSLLFSETAILRYQCIFRHIVYLRYVRQRLADVWVMEQKIAGNRNQIFLGIQGYSLRLRMYHLVQSLIALASEALEPNFHQLMKTIDTVESVDELLEVHDHFLYKCLIEALLLFEISTGTAVPPSKLQSHLFDNNSVGGISISSSVPGLSGAPGGTTTMHACVTKLLSTCVLFVTAVEDFIKRFGGVEFKSSQDAFKGSYADINGSVVNASESVSGRRDVPTSSSLQENNRGALQAVVSNEHYRKMIGKFERIFETQLQTLLTQSRNISKNQYEHFLQQLIIKLDYNGFYSEETTSKI